MHQFFHGSSQYQSMCVVGMLAASWLVQMSKVESEQIIPFLSGAVLQYFDAENEQLHVDCVRAN